MASFCRIKYIKGCLSAVYKGSRYFQNTSVSGVRWNSNWQLCSAVCLERYPTITSEKSTLEKRFEAFMTQLEYENSHLSDHELREIEDREIAEKRKKDSYEETEAESVRLTSAEMEDKWTTELTGFNPASQVTEADEKNDLRSVERKLDRKLILLVKQELGHLNQWLLPILRRKEGESMRQTAERALQTLTGNKIEAVFLGNAPCAYFSYRHPKSPTEDGLTGTKVFIFKAQLKKGQVDIEASKDISDFMWVTKEETKDFCPQILHEQIDRSVIDIK